jgi:hydroxypyruvate isomerase
VEEQEKIGRTMDQLGMTMGVFVAAGAGAFNKVTFAGHDPAVWESVLQEIRASVDVAKRVNAKWMTVVPGHYDDRLEWDYQTANCIELLKRCSEIFEPHGYVMVLEGSTGGPITRACLSRFRWRSQICRAVAARRCDRSTFIPADHRGEPHPEHQRGVGRNRLLPGGRQPGPQ